MAFCEGAFYNALSEVMRNISYKYRGHAFILNACPFYFLKRSKTEDFEKPFQFTF